MIKNTPIGLLDPTGPNKPFELPRQHERINALVYQTVFIDDVARDLNLVKRELDNIWNTVQLEITNMRQTSSNIIDSFKVVLSAIKLAMHQLNNQKVFIKKEQEKVIVVEAKIIQALQFTLDKLTGHVAKIVNLSTAFSEIAKEFKQKNEVMDVVAANIQEILETVTSLDNAKNEEEARENMK